MTPQHHEEKEPGAPAPRTTDAPARRAAAGAPAIRAGAILAMLAAVLAAGTLAVGAVMAHVTGAPIGSVLREAVQPLAALAADRPWTLAGVVGLVAAFWLALITRGALQMALIWGIVAAIGVGLADALLSRPQAGLAVQADGSATVELRRSPNGHYMIDGALDGVSTRFIVDTGASLTAIPQSLAREARITGCVPQVFSTAGGSTAGCVARASELVFGGFRIDRPQVAVLPQMQGAALLGMDVLGRLHIEQRGGVLRLTAPAATD